MSSELSGILFETERLVVRLYTLDDEENFFLLNGSEEVVRYIRPAKTREECAIFLKEIIKYSVENPMLGRWAVDEKATGDTVGMFALFPVNDSDKLQLGYSLLKGSWDKGYASELTRHGLIYFRDTIGQPEIYAYTESPNIASAKVLEKCGFILTGDYEKEGKVILEYLFRISSLQ